MKNKFVVVEQAFEYNDEYMYCVDGSSPEMIFNSRSKAEAYARSKNKSFFLETVANDAYRSYDLSESFGIYDSDLDGIRKGLSSLEEDHLPLPYRSFTDKEWDDFFELLANQPFRVIEVPCGE